MNSWQIFFDLTVVINLKKREDRLARFSKMASEYNFNFDLYEAIENEKGYYGLVLTMQKLFRECISAGYNRVMVFEDDAKIIVSSETFHDTMNKCCEDLSGIGWHLFYAGLQPCLPFKGFETKNLLRVNHGQATHAVGYNKEAMQFIANTNIDEPIDNWIVKELQPRYPTFASHPLLVTQEEGYSDICRQHINWDVYITPRYEEQLKYSKWSQNSQNY